MKKYCRVCETFFTRHFLRIGPPGTVAGFGHFGAVGSGATKQSARSPVQIAVNKTGVELNMTNAFWPADTTHDVPAHRQFDVVVDGLG